MKTIRYFSLVLVLVLVMGQFTLSLAASPPFPTYASAIVDTSAAEWDKSYDFFADMIRAWGNGGQTEVLSKLYLRYDCSTETLFALVEQTTYPIVVEPDGDTYLKVDGDKKIFGFDPDDTTNPQPNFGWHGLSEVSPGYWQASGWEGKTALTPGNYSLTVHNNILDSSGTQTSGVDNLSLEISCQTPTDDFGDLPIEYTGLTLGGASHQVNSLYLGECVTTELDGQPKEDADLDDCDDGIVYSGNWQTGVGQALQVTVTGGDGCLFGWLDYGPGGGYNFEFSGNETLLYNYEVTDGQNIITTFINPTSVDSNSLAFARFRLLPRIDGGCDYGGGLTQLDMLTGSFIGGEVEDYLWVFGPNAISLAGFTASSDSLPTIWIAVAALLLIAGITVFAWMRRRTA